MSKKYIDIEGLRHIVNRLYNRDFDGMGLSHIDFTQETADLIDSHERHLEEIDENSLQLQESISKATLKLELLTLISTGARRHLDAIFTNYDTLPDDMLDFLDDIKPGFKVAWEVYKAWDPNTTNAQGYFKGREDIIFMPPIDVSHVTNAAAMFKDCINLKEVGDLNFKSCERFWSTITKSGWLYCDLFKNCPSLEEIGDVDISGLVCDKVRLSAPNASGITQNWGYLTGWWRVNGLFNSLPSLRKFGKLTFPADKSFTGDNGIINNFSNTSFTNMFSWSGIDLTGRFQELLPPYHCYSLYEYYGGCHGFVGNVHLRTHEAVHVFWCLVDGFGGGKITFDNPSLYAMKQGELKIDGICGYMPDANVYLDLTYVTNAYWPFESAFDGLATELYHLGYCETWKDIDMASMSWGVIRNEKSLWKPRMLKSLYNNSKNRAAAGWDPFVVRLSDESYSALSTTDIANITAKGYTITHN